MGADLRFPNLSGESPRERWPAREGKVLAGDLTPSFIKLLATLAPFISFLPSCSLVTTPVSRLLLFSFLGCHLGCVLSRNFWEQKSSRAHSRLSSGGISGTRVFGWRRCSQAPGVGGGDEGAFLVPLDLTTQAATSLLSTSQGAVRAPRPGQWQEARSCLLLSF